MASYNIGEEIAGLYLQIEKGCDFVQYNLYTPSAQGEIDVVAVNFRAKIVYVCEVAVHLITGLQYTKENQPDVTARLIKKFTKDIAYAEQAFPDFQHVFMLWSPIVKTAGAAAKHDQLRDLTAVQTYFLDERGITLQLIINEAFQECFGTLRRYAATRTEELKSPILRVFQIEELLARHLGRKQKPEDRTALPRAVRPPVRQTLPGISTDTEIQRLVKSVGLTNFVLLFEHLVTGKLNDTEISTFIPDSNTPDSKRSIIASARRIIREGWTESALIMISQAPRISPEIAQKARLILQNLIIREE